MSSIPNAFNCNTAKEMSVRCISGGVKRSNCWKDDSVYRRKHFPGGGWVGWEGVLVWFVDRVCYSRVGWYGVLTECVLIGFVDRVCYSRVGWYGVLKECVLIGWVDSVLVGWVDNVCWSYVCWSTRLDSPRPSSALIRGWLRDGAGQQGINPTFDIEKLHFHETSIHHVANACRRVWW